MSDFSRRLRTLRKRDNMTQPELAKKLGVSRSAVSMYELGEREPDYGTLLKATALFGVSSGFLLGEESSREDFHLTPTLIPILGDVAAGLPMFVEENIIDYEEISSDMASQGECFALRIRGESMEPKFSEGDVVIIRQQSDVETGDIAVVLVNGDSATVKKIKKRPEGLMLVPLNAAFEPMFYSNDEIRDLPVQVLGRVVELRAKF